MKDTKIATRGFAFTKQFESLIGFLKESVLTSINHFKNATVQIFKQEIASTNKLRFNKNAFLSASYKKSRHYVITHERTEFNETQTVNFSQFHLFVILDILKIMADKLIFFL